MQDSNMSDTITGTVVYFSAAKGYGFLKADPEFFIERDVFVHWSAVDSTGYKQLFQGERVKFGLKDDRKGMIAVDVEILSPSPDRVKVNQNLKNAGMRYNE